VGNKNTAKQTLLSQAFLVIPENLQKCSKSRLWFITCLDSYDFSLHITGEFRRELCKRLCWLGSSISIVNDYGPNGPAIESRWRRDFLPIQTGPGAHPAPCKMGSMSFPGGWGVKCIQGVVLATHPLLVPRSWKSRAMPLSTLWATPGL
jgi:hypothetical protein